jgi:hypothetical protein
MVAPGEGEERKETERGSGYSKPRTTNRWMSVEDGGQ